MKKSDSNIQNLANASVIISGIALAWFKYFAKPVDEFSPVSSPWQIVSYNAHIITSPILVLAIGMIWHNHIWARWKNGTIREFGKLKIHTGRILLFLIVPMIWSGYVLQTTADETGRKILIPIHLISSALWSLAFVMHLLKGKVRIRKKKPAKHY
jgi:hypothetical protein